RQSRALKDKEKALTAEKMLKSTLTLTPRLSGEDMVAKYNALLKAAILLRGGKLPAPNSSPEGGQNSPITTSPAPAAAPTTTPAAAPNSAVPMKVPTTPTSARRA